MQSGISAFWKMTPATRTAFSANNTNSQGSLLPKLQQMDNVEVLFEAKGTGVSQDGETVTLLVETLEGLRELCGKYLIAADGASSVIRIS